MSPTTLQVSTLKHCISLHTRRNSESRRSPRDPRKRTTGLPLPSRPSSPPLSLLPALSRPLNRLSSRPPHRRPEQDVTQRHTPAWRHGSPVGLPVRPFSSRNPFQSSIASRNFSINPPRFKRKASFYLLVSAHPCSTGVTYPEIAHPNPNDPSLVQCSLQRARAEPQTTPPDHSSGYAPS